MCVQSSVGFYHLYVSVTSSLKQLILDKVVKIGIKLFHLMCTFVLIFGVFEKESIGTVVILPLMCRLFAISLLHHVNQVHTKKTSL